MASFYSLYTEKWLLVYYLSFNFTVSNIIQYESAITLL